jgi:hypothetical protein
MAAIYARKSTEQTGTAEEAKSVTWRIEHARVCGYEGVDDRRGARVRG